MRKTCALFQKALSTHLNLLDASLTSLETHLSSSLLASSHRCTPSFARPFSASQPETTTDPTPPPSKTPPETRRKWIPYKENTRTHQLSPSASQNHSTSFQHHQQPLNNNNNFFYPLTDLNRNFKAEALYVGSRIDVRALKRHSKIEPHWNQLENDTLTVALSPHPLPDNAETEGFPEGCPMMLAYSYGSVVFFDAPSEVKKKYMDVCRKASTDPLIMKDSKFIEEYGINIVPTLPTWSKAKPDKVCLQRLDLRNAKVIGQVLAQSVAVDYYASHIEKKLDTFIEMNKTLKNERRFTKLKTTELLQLVADNNLLATNIIQKVGLRERYDIAWKDIQYFQIWEHLRKELEIEKRYATFDDKLTFLQENLKYFLEVRQARRSFLSEATIIGLITLELLVLVFQMFQVGGGGGLH